MISVVTPTMWRARGVFLQALTNYIRSDIVSDIVIINNDMRSTPEWPELLHPKVRLINKLQNIYVNPAWNLGVAKALSDKICIANDDIVFNAMLLAKIYDRITPLNGVHGIVSGEAQFNHPPTTDGKIDFSPWSPGDNIHCFGQLMFLHRYNWVPIIDGLDIYFGDDFIFHNHLVKGLTNFLISNIDFFSPMASTTKDTLITSGAYDRERPIFGQWYHQNPIPQKS